MPQYTHNLHSEPNMIVEMGNPGVYLSLQCELSFGLPALAPACLWQASLSQAGKIYEFSGLRPLYTVFCQLSRSPDMIFCYERTRKNGIAHRRYRQIP